jgi:hypothetical protein
VANINAPFGFRHIGQGNTMQGTQLRMYCIPLASTDQINPGDAVKVISGGDANGISYIGKVTNGTDAVRGVVEGILLVTPTNVSTQGVLIDDINLYAPATKTHDYYALVRDDPSAEYLIQGDASATLQVATACNLNASFTVANPSGGAKQSASVLGGATINTTNALNLRILGLHQAPGNGFGAYAVWRVKFNLTDLANGATGI